MRRTTEASSAAPAAVPNTLAAAGSPLHVVTPVRSSAINPLTVFDARNPVVETATPGPAYLRLICYIADATGRRVIHGFCGAFEVLAAGSPAGAPVTGTINDPCPPTARLVVSDTILRASTALGSSFNQVITPLGG